MLVVREISVHRALGSFAVLLWIAACCYLAAPRRLLPDASQCRRAPGRLCVRPLGVHRGAALRAGAHGPVRGLPQPQPMDALERDARVKAARRHILPWCVRERGGCGQLLARTRAGGSFAEGSDQGPFMLYSGQYTAKHHEVVFLTSNYRLVRVLRFALCFDAVSANCCVLDTCGKHNFCMLVCLLVCVGGAARGRGWCLLPRAGVGGAACRARAWVVPPAARGRERRGRGAAASP